MQKAVKTHALATMAPQLELTAIALDQFVAWTGESGLKTLRQFIAAHAPRSAAALGAPSEESPQPVPSVGELTTDQLRELVIARLSAEDEHSGLAVAGGKGYTIQQLISEIRANTPLGQRLMAAERQSIALLEQLAEAGKLRCTQPEPSPVELPDFDF